MEFTGPGKTMTGVAVGIAVVGTTVGCGSGATVGCTGACVVGRKKVVGAGVGRLAVTGAGVGRLVRIGTGGGDGTGIGAGASFGRNATPKPMASGIAIKMSAQRENLASLRRRYCFSVNAPYVPE